MLQGVTVVLPAVSYPYALNSAILITLSRFLRLVPSGSLGFPVLLSLTVSPYDLAVGGDQYLREISNL